MYPLKSLYIRPKYDATDNDGTTVAKDVVTLATFNGCRQMAKLLQVVILMQILELDILCTVIMMLVTPMRLIHYKHLSHRFISFI